MVLILKQFTHQDAELLAAACAIRQTVFLQEYGLDPALDTDAEDSQPTTSHFVGFDTELQLYVAAARATVVPDTKTIQLARIAVLQEARGRRHGLTLVQFAVNHLRQSDSTQEAEKLILFCPLDKCRFYAKCGFAESSHVELIRHLTLHEMVLEL